MRGIVTYEIPGAELECLIHINDFILSCKNQLELQKNEASKLNNLINAFEQKWLSKTLIPKPISIGGGGFVSITINEEYMIQQEHLHELEVKND